jgi:hypothetical protein
VTKGLATLLKMAHVWRAILLFAASLCLTLALMAVASRLPSPVALAGIEIACARCDPSVGDALAMFALQERWLAFALLLVTAAAGAVSAAAVTLIGIANERDAGGRRSSRVTAAVALAGLSAAAFHVTRLSWCEATSHGFLSSLLSTVASSGGQEDVIRDMVWPMRSVGEGAALFVGAAMAATASPCLDTVTLARRIERLQLLLYCGSLLFVAGILMSESNFTWITAHWVVDPEDGDFAKAIGEIVKAGTLQSGIAYSALLAIYFLPARSVLAWQARQMGARGQAQAQEVAALVGSWRSDLKQVLALVAPVLTAPLLDALLV